MPNCDFYVFNPFEDFGAGLPARGYPQTLVRYTKAGDRFRDTCRGQVWFSRLAEFVGGLSIVSATWAKLDSCSRVMLWGRLILT